MRNRGKEIAANAGPGTKRRGRLDRLLTLQTCIDIINQRFKLCLEIVL